MRPRYIILIIILIVGGFLIARMWVASPEGDESALKKYENTAYGISFAYPATYVVNEMDVMGEGAREHYAITLTRAEDLPLPINGEGPPMIIIDIYENDTAEQTAEDWIRNADESNFDLGGETIASTQIDGLPASSYRWSGLYEGTTIVLVEAKWIYNFTVTYLEIGAPIVQDFVPIRDSVRIDPDTN